MTIFDSILMKVRIIILKIMEKYELEIIKKMILNVL